MHSIEAQSGVAVFRPREGIVVAGGDFAGPFWHGLAAHFAEFGCDEYSATWPLRVATDGENSSGSISAAEYYRGVVHAAASQAAAACRPLTCELHQTSRKSATLRNSPPCRLRAVAFSRASV